MWSVFIVQMKWNKNQQSWVTQLVHLWNPKTEMSCHFNISESWQNLTTKSNSKKDIYTRWSMVYTSCLEFRCVSVAFSTEMNECESVKHSHSNNGLEFIRKGSSTNLARLAIMGSTPIRRSRKGWVCIGGMGEGGPCKRTRNLIGSPVSLQTAARPQHRLSPARPPVDREGCVGRSWAWSSKGGALKSTVFSKTMVHKE